MQYFIEFNTENKIDAQIYTYIGYNLEELVSRIGNAQRNNQLGGVDS
jgi:hypothetical protein